MRVSVVMLHVALGFSWLAGVDVAGQTLTLPTVVDSHPFGACRAVVSEPSGTGSLADERFVTGHGGGVHLLKNAGSFQPTLADDPMNRIFTGGFTRDLALTPDMLYVADGINVFQGYQRPVTARTFLAQPIPEMQTDVWTLDVVTIGTVDYALVGTHEGPFFTGGKVYLYRILHGDPGNPVFVASFDVGANIYTIEASVDLAGSTITAFVGTACGQSPLCESLLRLFESQVL